MNDFFHANNFFITATVMMLVCFFTATVLLVYVLRLLAILKDILESLRTTTKKIETVSGDVLEGVQDRFNDVNGIVETLLSLFIKRPNVKETKTEKKTRAVSKTKNKKVEKVAEGL